MKSAWKIWCLGLVLGRLLFADPLAVDSPTVSCHDSFALLGFHDSDSNGGKLNEAIGREFYSALKETFPGASIRLIEKTKPYVLMVETKEGQRVVAKTVREDSTLTRVRFQNEANLTEAMGQNFVPVLGKKSLEAKKHGELPIYWMPYFTDGSLKQNLKFIGDYADPTEMIRLMGMMVQPLDTLHQKGYGNGDLKPDNYLVVRKNGRIEKILMTDLGGVTRLDDEYGSAVFTPDYVDPRFSPWELEDSKQFYQSLKKRDMKSLRISFQEMAFGRSFFHLNEREPGFFNVYQYKGRDKTYAVYQLRKSPYSLVRSIHPVISAIAWTEFPDTETLLGALAKGQEAIQKGTASKFFKETLIPIIRRTMRPEEAALLISRSDELYRAFTQRTWGFRRERLFDRKFYDLVVEMRSR